MAEPKKQQQQLDLKETQQQPQQPPQQQQAQPPATKAAPQVLKTDEIKDPVQRFAVIMNTYEMQVLPDLLKSFGIEPALFKQTVINEVKRSDKLMEAFIKNPASMFASILAGAQIGLIPSEMLGLFYLIPRNLKQSDGRYLPTVTPLIGYKGIVNILMRSPDITRIHTEVVYKGDVFEPVYGLEPNIIHKPNFEASRTAADITHVYAVVKMRGEHNFAIMTREQILAVKAMSKYDNDLYFNDKQNPNRWMERKTALIQLAKMLPKEYHLNLALEMDSKLNGGATAILDDEGNVKFVEGSIIRPTRFRNIYGTFGKEQQQPQLPDGNQ